MKEGKRWFRLPEEFESDWGSKMDELVDFENENCGAFYTRFAGWSAVGTDGSQRRLQLVIIYAN